MPRLSIVHPDGVFVNSLTDETFKVLNGVALGMVKQRAMFHKEMGKEKLKPQCKSSDAVTGYPTMQGNEKDLFPWDKVPFTPHDLAKDEHGRLTIPCASCPLAQWGEKKTPPPCAERHAYPVLFSDKEDWQPGDELPYSGIVTFQKSGIKPSVNFLRAFHTSKLPVYSSYMQIKLNREKTGMIVYSVPEFKRISPTDREDWPNYRSDLAAVRELLRQPPRPPEDGDSKESSSASSGKPASTSVVDSTATVSTEDPWAPTVDDDELPF